MSVNIKQQILQLHSLGVDESTIASQVDTTGEYVREVILKARKHAEHQQVKDSVFPVPPVNISPFILLTNNPDVLKALKNMGRKNSDKIDGL